MCLLVAVALAVPQYEQYGGDDESYGSKSTSQVSHAQWAALNPYGTGAGVPAVIQRQWDSLLVKIKVAIIIST